MSIIFHFGIAWEHSFASICFVPHSICWHRAWHCSLHINVTQHCPDIFLAYLYFSLGDVPCHIPSCATLQRNGIIYPHILLVNVLNTLEVTTNGQMVLWNTVRPYAHKHLLMWNKTMGQWRVMLECASYTYYYLSRSRSLSLLLWFFPCLYHPVLPTIRKASKQK